MKKIFTGFLYDTNVHFLGKFKSKIHLLASKTLIFGLLLFFAGFSAQIVQTFDKPGTYTFKVPEGVNKIKVEAWGSGSGGNNSTRRGGGGGAFAADYNLSVTPGTSYTVTVGKGAAVGSGSDGQDSRFANLVVAKGATGATGGQASNSLGTIKHSGGNGGVSTIGAGAGAGGGGSAGFGGPGKNGGNTSSNTGGEAGSGGLSGGASGGIGGNYNSNGGDGAFPGGGGGERGENNWFQNSSGAGGDGQVIVTYVPRYLAQIISADTGLPTWCAGETRNVSVTIKNIGSHPWTDGDGNDFNIGIKWNQNQTLNSWTDYHVRVDAENLAPGATKTYYFTITASNNVSGAYTTPLSPGTNHLTFDVVLEGKSWFAWNLNDVGPGNAVHTTGAQTISALPTAPGSVTPGSATTVCAGSAILLKATSSGNLIDWYTAPTGGTKIGTSNSGADFTVSPTANTTYYAEARNSNGCVSSSRTATARITVNPASVGGVVSSPQNICPGSSPASLSLSGQTGTVVKWQMAANETFTVSVSDIAVTGTTLSGSAIGNLNTDTYFRAVVQSGSCAVAYSSPVLVKMMAPLSNNTITFSNGTSGKINATAVENTNATFTAPAGTYFSNVNFASYGTPTGTAPNFVINADCHAATSQAKTEELLLGKSGQVIIPANNEVFDDPCVGTLKKLSVVVSYAEAICSGQSVTINGSVPSGGDGNFAYEWESSTTSATAGFAPAPGTRNTASYTISGLTQTTWFRRKVTIACSSSYSGVVLVKVNPSIVAGVSISASEAVVCAGSPVAFTATPTNGGTMPKYQWQINGTDVSGATNATFTSSTLTNNAQVSVLMTSNEGPCLIGSPVKSNILTITVNPLVAATVNITSNAGNSVCNGTAVTFTASPTLAGTSPKYQWQINATDVPGATNATFTVATLRNGDKVSVKMTPTPGPCFANPVVTSNIITMTVTQPVVAGVTITSNAGESVCEGKSITFTATGINGGTAPAYQWNVNGAPVLGETASTFTTSALRTGDKVTVSFTPSAQLCASTDSVLSNAVTVTNLISVFENNKWSKGIPTAENQLSAEIRSAYTTKDGAVNACSVHLTNNAEVIVVPNNPLIIFNSLNLDNGTKLTVESDASLIQVNDNAPANSGNIKVLRDINIKPKSAEYNYFGSPVTFAAGQTMKTIYPGITYVLYHNEANNFFYNSSGANIPGRGLAVKEPTITAEAPTGNAKVTATFIGVPQNGIINYALANSNSATSSHLGYNLVGNPYPSNIDLQALYDLNKGKIEEVNSDPISTSFYFWDSTANNVYVQAGSSYGGQAYAVFNAKSGSKGMGTPATGPAGSSESRKVPKGEVVVGQGFMVKALKKNAVLQFNNSIRTDKNSGVKFIGTKGEEVVDNRLWLTLTTPGNLSSTLGMVYFEGGSAGAGAEDSESRGGSDEIFSIVAGKNMAINGKGVFADSDVVPLGTRHFAAGLHTISIEKAEGIFAQGQQIYLKDKQTGIITNLSQGSYHFSASSGESTGRFEVVYKPGAVLATDAAVKEDVQVYRSGQAFTVKAAGKKITAIELYDMAGRLIKSAKPNATVFILNAEELANGVYLINIKQGDTVTVKKIIR